MAIVTLPYPNMDFVPLDVLTADELDQIVANIDAINNASIPTESIANSAITTAKLADDSVTSDKIDWATLPCITIKGTGTTQNALGKLPFTTVAYSQGTGLSLSSNGILIGAGITHVVVSASCYFSHNSGSTYAWCRLDINGLTTGNTSIAENSLYGSVNFPAIDLEVNEGDIISIWSNEAGQNFWGANSWLRASVI